MLDTALNGITNLVLQRQVRDDDIVDQLNHFVTVTILVIFAAITGFMQYVGQPINCWNYGNYVEAHYQDHVNKYCWAHTLYQYPNDANWSVMPYEMDDNGSTKNPTILDQKSEDEMGALKSFSHVTVLFIFQALCFKIPNVLWTMFNSSMGSNLIKMMDTLQESLFAHSDEKKEKLKQVALYLDQWLLIQRKRRLIIMEPFREKVSQFIYTSTSLSYTYLEMKFLFVINIIIQFYILSKFFRNNLFYGIEILQLYLEEDLMATTLPTVVLCHFKTYDNQKPLGIWVQCILSMNSVLRMLFLIEWISLLYLLLVTTMGLIIWIFFIISRKRRIRFVKQLLPENSVSQQGGSSVHVEEFVIKYLGKDGIFILEILRQNTNTVVVAQLLEELSTSVQYSGMLLPIPIRRPLLPLQSHVEVQGEEVGQTIAIGTQHDRDQYSTTCRRSCVMPMIRPHD